MMLKMLTVMSSDTIAIFQREFPGGGREGVTFGAFASLHDIGNIRML